jgi:FkbM family methyltransferase
MTEKYYSLSDSTGIPLDKKLDILFGGKQNGIYIELGAFDGLSQSNTAFFEFNRNWSGILIEPSKGSYDLCCKNRPRSIVLNMCCVSDTYQYDTIKGDFNSITMASVNGIRLNSDKLVEVNCTTLEKIIINNLYNKTIDLLTLDTEGYEFDILQGLNLDKNRPKYMLIEIYRKDYEKILNYLSSKNYYLHSNFSNYNKIDNPIWDGTHNDFLFCDSLTTY